MEEKTNCKSNAGKWRLRGSRGGVSRAFSRAALEQNGRSASPPPAVRRMASSDWLLLLGVLSLASVSAPEDPCGIKAKDAALEPRCVYRAPEGEPVDGEAPEASVPNATDRRVWELSAANARFALSLYRRVALGRSADSNVFLSPLGVSAAFSVTKLGACGRTLEEIVKVALASEPAAAPGGPAPN